MQRLTEFRAAVAAPDQDRLAAARARLVARLGTIPAPPVPAGWAPVAWFRSRSRPATPKRILLPAVTAVAAAAVAIVLVIVGVILLGGGSLTPSASATAFLRRAAAVAQARPVPGDNQFIYTEILLTGFPAPGREQRYREWQSVNGSQPGVLWANPCFPFGGNGTESMRNPRWPYPPSARPCWMAVQAGTRVPAAGSYAGLRTLPATPQALLAYILQHFRPGYLVPPGYPSTRADRQWEGLFIILEDNVVVPPKLAAAIFRALADIPGVTLVRDARNAVGHRGIGVAMTVDRIHSMLIFDPHTYQLIGWQPGWVVPVDRGISPHTPGIESANAVLQTAIVDHAPKARPRIVFQPNAQRYFTP